MNVITLCKTKITFKGFEKLASKKYFVVKEISGLLSIEGKDEIDPACKGEYFKGFTDPDFRVFLLDKEYTAGVFTEIHGVYYENALKDEKFIQEALKEPDGISSMI